MSAQAVDAMAVLRRLREQLPPGSQDPITFLRKDNPLAARADSALAAVAELITADREHDTTREALLSLNRRIAEHGWIDVEHDALRVAGQKFVAAQIRRARALERIEGGAA